MCTWENAPHTTTNQRYSESRALQKCSVTQLKAAHKVWSIVCGCSEDKRPGLQLGPAEDSPSFRRPWGAADQHRPQRPPTGEMPLRPRPHSQQFGIPRQRWLPL